MHGRSTLSRSTDTPRRALTMLTALTAALMAAFVVGPRALASIGPGGGFADERSLIATVNDAFVEYWNSGDRGFSPRMAGVVDYWVRYHLAKLAISAILLIVLLRLGLLLWKAFIGAAGSRALTRVGLASAGVLVTMLGLVALVTVMANVQGAVAPFASLMPMLHVGTTEGPLGAVLAQVRQQLAHTSSAGTQPSPVLDVMLDDYGLYHVAFVVIAAIVTLVLVGASVMLWRRFAKTASSDRRTRGVLALFAVAAAVFALVIGVVGLANASTVADPAPNLLALFQGGH